MKKVLYILIPVILFSCKKEINFNEQTVLASNVSDWSAASISGDYQIIMHEATPKQTDPAIQTNTIGDPTQYAYLPADDVNRKDNLLIFIPGTWSVPSGYDYICQAAASNGYYAFSVAYSNSKFLEIYMTGKYNDNTMENIMNEYLTGENTSPKVNVSRTNSFENRIIKMISYMDSLYPSENWRRFLTSNNDIIWEKLSVGGHSQGSDHAMYMSKVRPLFRAGFYGGPGSFKLRNGKFPSFMQNPGLTPSDRIYGFNHTRDLVRPWKEVRQVWAILGIPGAPDSVDDGDVNESHQLTTSMAGIDGHSGPITDEATPIDSVTGKPVFLQVWKYMLFPD